MLRAEKSAMCGKSRRISQGSNRKMGGQVKDMYDPVCTGRFQGELFELSD